MNSNYGWALALVATVGVLAIVFGAAYIQIMFEGHVSGTSLIEAANYAVQTITTIGYGNWVPDGRQPTGSDLLLMKLVSVPFMLAGASLFSVLIGIVTNRISRL